VTIISKVKYGMKYSLHPLFCKIVCYIGLTYIK